LANLGYISDIIIIIIIIITNRPMPIIGKTTDNWPIPIIGRLSMHLKLSSSKLVVVPSAR